MVVSVAGAFRVNPTVDLHWRDWGEDSIVLEGTSGQMLQFDALSAALMGCFEQGQSELSNVIDELARDLHMAPDQEFVDTVSAIVEEFQKLGWLEPIVAG